MGQIVAIFNQLGVDNTIVYQLALFIILYFGLKFIFLNKLAFVINQREKKTVLLEKEADHLLKKSDEMMDEFRRKMDSAQKNANEVLRSKRDNLNKDLRKKIDDERKVLSEGYAKRREQLNIELEVARKKALLSVDELSENLSKKLS